MAVLSEEILDIVDENDIVIGTMTRDQADTTSVQEMTGFLRASDMFLVNSHGELWVPTRTAHKRMFPNGLDFSVGGHVESGEDYLTTILRETEEEINLSLSAEDITLVNIERQDDSRYFNALYIHKTDQTPRYNPEDFQSAEWLSPQTLLEKIASGVPAKTNIKRAVERIAASELL